MRQRLFLACSLTLALLSTAVAQPAGLVNNCALAHQQCVAQRQAQCDRPQSTSDQRAQCLEACTQSLSSCTAKHERQTAALAEVERTGGPKPAQCPKGWMIEQRGTNSKLFGAFKCFATGAPGSEATLPASFSCPPGLTLTKGIDAVFCNPPQ